MASIDAFLELADGGFDLPPRARASQRFFPPRHARAARDPVAVREHRLTIAFVVAVDVVLLLALRWAMQPAPVARRVDDRTQLVFIESPHAIAPPVAVVTPPPSVREPPHPVRVPLPAAHSPTSSHALQAVRVPPPARPTSPSPPAENIHLYSADGRLLLPPPPAASGRRDLLAHQNTAGLVPGGYQPYRAALPVQASKLDKTVHLVQMLTGGGPYDPCPDLSRQMANVNDPDAIARAEQHYEQACEGH